MSTMRYAIVQLGSSWKLVSESRRMGHFATLQQASHVGANLVREAVKAGHDVELLVQGPYGEMSTERFSARPPTLGASTPHTVA